MAKFLTVSIAFAILFNISETSAQKGIPPTDVVNISTTTKYAQHVDFSQDHLKNLKVPEGWQVSMVASGLGKPRMLYLGKPGQLYVTRRDAGDILLLTDKNNDRKFDDVSIAVTDFKGVHGIAIKDGWLYGCNNNEVRRYKLKPDGSADSDTPEILIKDLPSGGQHSNRTIEFGKDGLLYITVGSVCNDCVGDKETATILAIDPKTWKRSIYASGLRNTIGFDWHPATGELWGVDNGSDFKGDTWPPEELNKLKKDADYGFPFAYGKREVDNTREDPVGATKDEVAKASEPSIMEFPAHSAPIAFQFFPTGAPLSGDALVCWHGSWNASNVVGYKVQRIMYKDGNPTAAEDFLSGFLINDKKERFGRPAGLVISETGTVYVSDDANGNIYCISPQKK
ncbi:MAG: glucose dehydrogenase [Flavobacterium sp.]|uniref:PQQ-dependent sugar dehydrogenase n=1 Tax=Flavobacterium sp. TaxID=239 RepID=UPI001205276C|nr:PQQ-dependent sugar dehydrogenase [Flavobacterium sp.]RZJ66309.1 MAG: glucose dehydrogenase [Flavobacterium sp.]